jgi:hypothetical protein
MNLRTINNIRIFYPVLNFSGNYFEDIFELEQRQISI